MEDYRRPEDRLRHRPLCIAMALAAGLCPLPAMAQAPLTFAADYAVRIYGLTVGRAAFNGTIGADTYKVDGTLRSAGLARIFDQTNATARITGRIALGRVTPERFILDFVQGDRRTTTDIAFRGGNVASTAITPEPKPSDKVIPVSRDDLQSVADPVSATLVARGTPEQVCGRTLRIFEGATRIDVALSLSEVGNVYGVGNGAVTCTGDFRPVSGFERDNGTFAYMRESADLRFVYAPAGPGTYTLHSLSARTEIGRVEMRAERRSIGAP